MTYRNSPPTQTAKEAAIQLLSRRDHGQYELKQKLILKGHEEEAIAAAVALCIEYGYLNDERFAQSQVRQHIYKGYGERRIRQELTQKQVAEHIISLVIAAQDQDWFELAKETAYKKFKGQPASDAKAYAKQVRFLQYRGFDFEQIRYALRQEDND